MKRLVGKSMGRTNFENDVRKHAKKLIDKFKMGGVNLLIKSIWTLKRDHE